MVKFVKRKEGVHESAKDKDEEKGLPWVVNRTEHTVLGAAIRRMGEGGEIDSGRRGPAGSTDRYSGDERTSAHPLALREAGGKKEGLKKVGFHSD